MQPSGHKKTPTLASLRGSLSTIQKKLIEELWIHYFEKFEWPSTRSLYSRHGKPLIREQFLPLTGNVLSDDHHVNGQSSLGLTLLGVFLTEKGEDLQKLFAKLFEVQRSVFQTAPEQTSITSVEIQNTLKLNPADLKSLGLLVRLARVSGGHGASPTDPWSVSTMQEAEDFPIGQSLMPWAEKWAFRFYNPQLATFREDRDSKTVALPISEPFDQNTQIENNNQIGNAGNPLKKRYQVFVSSTYEDLIEERKHVMQALLATKCIPSGMELFPAASTAQWNLIKSVIDDCDYYVVVVAGKYGSIGPEGKSYTEMEFDYAVAKNKSILGFYHSDLQLLIGKKLEQGDEKRTKLNAFIEKVKSRMCQSWTTPDNLASAIKTAIYHAIESDPKSGWVRTNELPSWSMVNSLKERISELEGRKTPNKKDVPEESPTDFMEFAATVTWSETSEPYKYQSEREQFAQDFKFKLSLDALFVCFSLKAGKSSLESGLKERLQKSLAKLCTGKISKKSESAHIILVAVKILPTDFQNIFNQFVARGYFVSLTQSYRSNSWTVKKRIMWKLTAKGIKKMAECKTKSVGGVIDAVTNGH